MSEEITATGTGVIINSPLEAGKFDAWKVLESGVGKRCGRHIKNNC